MLNRVELVCVISRCFALYAELPTVSRMMCEFEPAPTTIIIVNCVDCVNYVDNVDNVDNVSYVGELLMLAVAPAWGIAGVDSRNTPN